MSEKYIVLTPEQESFLKSRSIMVRAWRGIGPALIMALSVFFGFLYLSAPMLLSPFEVMNRLQAETIDLTTLQTMAIMMPMVLLLLCVVLLLIIVLMYAVFRKERRYLAILEQEKMPQ